MRTIFQLAALSAIFFSAAAAAHAVPQLYYNPATGNLKIENDVDFSIINIKSPTGALHAPSFPEGAIPSPVVLDKGDLPYFLVTLNTPVGLFNLGPGTVTPGTPISALSFDWYVAFGRPANVGVISLPEPSTALMAIVASIGFVGALRRRRHLVTA